MGLHGDVKGCVKDTFPDAFVDACPPVDMAVVDFMWLLYRYPGRKEPTGLGLVQFALDQVENFARGRGKRFVMCFDVGAYVPTAKRVEQQKRRVRAVALDANAEVGDGPLPTPWEAAMSTGAVRKRVVEYLAEALERAVAERGFRIEVVIHSARGIRTIADGVCRDDPRSETCKIGEADLSVVYWLKEYPDDATVIRALDSDEIAIMTLWCVRSGRQTPLYLWLAAAGRAEGVKRSRVPYFVAASKADVDTVLARLHAKETILSDEKRDVLDVLRLVALCPERLGHDAANLAWIWILQSTDFAEKIVRSVSVVNTLDTCSELLSSGEAAMVEVRDGVPHVDRAHTKRLLARVAIEGGPRRGKLMANASAALLRARWNFLYWWFAVDGVLGDDLNPLRTRDGRSVHGWLEDFSRAKDAECFAE